MRAARAAAAVLAVFAALLFCGCAPRENGYPAEKNGARMINHSVFLVNFKEGGFDEGFAEEFTSSANESETGLGAFFAAESLGKLSVTTRVLGEITVEKGLDYYDKKSIFNSAGYDVSEEGKHVDPFYREQTLIREIIAKADIPEDYAADADGDGYVDAVTFVFNAEFDGNDGDILWPHESEFYGTGVLGGFYVPEGYFEGVDLSEDLCKVFINGAEAKTYSIVCKKNTAGDICHEFTHQLGAPDYYSYVKSSSVFDTRTDNIGGYELLGASPGKIPQFSLAYVRRKIGWLSDGEEIAVTAAPGEFTLYPVTEGKTQALKIIPPDFPERKEYFMVEARRKTPGSFDDAVNSTGIIIYAVNEENAFIGADGQFGSYDYGNMYGYGNYEVRFIMNRIIYNYFTAAPGYNSSGDIAYGDGASSGVSVADITENEDGSFTFNVDYAREYAGTSASPSLKNAAGGYAYTVTWEAGEGGKVYIVSLAPDSYTAAAFAIDDLPSAEDVRSGKFGRFGVYGVEEYNSEARLVTRAFTNTRYLLAVGFDGDGKQIFYEKFLVEIAGQESDPMTFFALLSVVFEPWKPAYIALLASLGLCVLAGFSAVIYRSVKRNKPRFRG